MSKDNLITIAWIILCLVIIAIAVWMWFFADCQTLKAINSYAPARCIQ